LGRKQETYEGVVPEKITLPDPAESVYAEFPYMLYYIDGCCHGTDEVGENLPPKFDAINALEAENTCIAD
jgi:hypothetical protein